MPVRSIAVNKLEPGMVIGKDITRGNMILLGKGTELNELLIERIKRMELPIIYIVGEREEPITHEEALMRLDRRFKNVIEKPFMKLLKDTVQRRIEAVYGQDNSENLAAKSQ